MGFRLRAAVIAAVLLIGFGSGLVGHAQDASVPVTVVTHVDVRPDMAVPNAADTAARLFRAESAATLKDPGIVSYVVLQQNGAANHFTIVETWRDAKAYTAHLGSEHTVKFRMDILPFLGSPFDSRSHHEFR